MRVLLIEDEPTTAKAIAPRIERFGLMGAHPTAAARGHRNRRRRIRRGMSSGSRAMASS